MYIIKNTPIFSNKKLYRVGEQFPYSDKDKHLLWNLTLVEETKSIPKDEVSEVPETSETPIVIETPKIVSKAKTKKSISKK